jgi:chromate transporter
MSLWKLALLIALFNVMTFGNGPVMIPLLQTHLVEGAHVLTEDQLLYAFTIARVTPGQANFYVASIGYMLYGMPGAIVTTLAIILPGYIMIPLLHGLEHLRESPWIKGFTKGLTVTSVGLILAAVVQIARGTLTQPIAWIILIATLVMTQLLKWNIVVALPVASCLGLLLKWLL